MRKSVSVAFFSLMSTLLIFGTVIMGGSELVLFSNYFAQERYDVLDEVVNVAQRTASHLVQEAARARRPICSSPTATATWCWPQTRTIWPGMW